MNISKKITQTSQDSMGEPSTLSITHQRLSPSNACWYKWLQGFKYKIISHPRKMRILSDIYKSCAFSLMIVALMNYEEAQDKDEYDRITQCKKKLQ